MKDATDAIKRRLASEIGKHLAKRLAELGEGAHIDAFVAQHIMGWELVAEDGEQPEAVPYLASPAVEGEKMCWAFYPSTYLKYPEVAGFDELDKSGYSTSHDAAFRVADKIRGMRDPDGHGRWRFSLKDIPAGYDVPCGEEAVQWEATFEYRKDAIATPPEKHERHSMRGATVPLAICRAALLAVAVHYGAELTNVIDDYKAAHPGSGPVR